MLVRERQAERIAFHQGVEQGRRDLDRQPSVGLGPQVAREPDRAAAAERNGVEVRAGMRPGPLSVGGLRKAALPGLGRPAGARPLLPGARDRRQSQRAKLVGSGRGHEQPRFLHGLAPNRGHIEVDDGDILDALHAHVGAVAAVEFFFARTGGQLSVGNGGKTDRVCGGAGLRKKENQGQQLTHGEASARPIPHPARQWGETRLF